MGWTLEDAVPTKEQCNVSNSELTDVLDYIFDSKKPSNPADAIKKAS